MADDKRTGPAGDEDDSAGLDAFERATRLRPAIAVALPAAVALVAFPTGDADWLKAVLPLITGAAALATAAAVARTAGRAAQDEIFSEGLPAQTSLRHRDGLSEPEIADLHDAVSAATGVELPTAAEEAASPVNADGTYRIAVTRLIEATRDAGRFPLLHKENRNYGFLRNLYGLRSVGTAVAAAATVAGVVFLVVGFVNDERRDIGLAAVTILSGAVALFVFASWLTPARVRVPAHAYRDRLFEAARTLAAEKRPTGGTTGDDDLGS